MTDRQPPINGSAQKPFYYGALAVLVVFILWVARDVLVPIAVAFLIWFLINALAGSIRQALAPAVPIGRLGARLLATAILLGLIFLAGNVLSAAVADLARDAADRQGAVLVRLTELASAIGVESMVAPERLRELLKPEIWLVPLIDIARGIIANVSLVALYVIFLLVDERYYDAKIRALVPDRTKRADVTETLASLGQTTRLYLWLMSLISAGVALLTFLVCAAVGLEGAGFWGLLAFALNFVPTIGSILAVALPGLYGLATLADPALLVAMIVALGAVQFVAGEIVVPRLMGDRLNLSSFVILLTLVVWGAVWGPVGMFLAIPITVILALIAARFSATRPIAILLSKDGAIPEIASSRTDAT